MDTFWQDLRYGGRMLMRTPVLTIIITMTLGLGIGANAAIFSVVSTFMLRPLPVQNPNELTVLAITHPGNEEPHNISYPDFQDIRRASSPFAALAGIDLAFEGVSDGDRSFRMILTYVTGNYFEMLGLKPALGRLIEGEAAETRGAKHALVLGYDCWKRKFNGDPAVIGRSLRVQGQSVTIVGVAPQGFIGTYSIVDMDGYLPLGMYPLLPNNEDTLTKRDNHSLRVLARLKPGATLAQARASAEVMAQQLATQYPDTDKGLRLHVYPERLARPEPSSAQQNPILAMIFLVLVGLVLLVACVNVANILLARATAREKELAVRAALGAGRGRLVRQLLTESGLLAVLGAGAGLLFGWWASLGLQRIEIPGGIPFWMDLSLDWRSVGYLTLVAAVSGILVGLVPALRVSRADLNQVLREGGRGMSGGVERHRLRNLLVVFQVAGSMILLVAGGLFIRSMSSAESADLGFRADHVLTLSLDTIQAGMGRTRSDEFYRELERRVRAMPSVESAGLAYSIPLGYYSNGDRVIAEGQTLPPGEKGLIAGYNAIGTDYLRTMRTPLLRGREFTESDTENSRPVAVINDTMAKKLWPGQDAIGKRFSSKGPKGPYIEVVGITPTGKYGFLFEDPEPYFYEPLSQSYQSLRVLFVRTAAPPASMGVTLQKEIHAIDPAMPVFEPITMEEMIAGGNGFFLVRMGAMFAGVLGGLGLLLAVVGVYGVVSYSATQRTHEIGVRMALGAQRGDILRMVLRQGIALVGMGIGLGAAAALGLGRFLANFLFGIRSYDPLTYGGVTLLLILVAALACLIPARRATRVDPIVALRYE